MWELSVLSAQIPVNLKLLLKNKVLILKNYLTYNAHFPQMPDSKALLE